MGYFLTSLNNVQRCICYTYLFILKLASQIWRCPGLYNYSLAICIVNTAVYPRIYEFNGSMSPLGYPQSLGPACHAQGTRGPWARHVTHRVPKGVSEPGMSPLGYPRSLGLACHPQGTRGPLARHVSPRVPGVPGPGMSPLGFPGSLGPACHPQGTRRSLGPGCHPQGTQGGPLTNFSYFARYS